MAKRFLDSSALPAAITDTPAGKVGIGTKNPGGTLSVENGSGTATICLNGNCRSSLSPIQIIKTNPSGWVYKPNNAWYGSAIATCPGGYLATGGGGTCDSAGGLVALFNASPSGTMGFSAECVNTGTDAVDPGGVTSAACGAVAHVYCMPE